MITLEEINNKLTKASKFIKKGELPWVADQIILLVGEEEYNYLQSMQAHVLLTKGANYKPTPAITEKEFFSLRLIQTKEKSQFELVLPV